MAFLWLCYSSRMFSSSVENDLFHFQRKMAQWAPLTLWMGFSFGDKGGDDVCSFVYLFVSFPYRFFFHWILPMPAWLRGLAASWTLTSITIIHREASEWARAPGLQARAWWGGYKDTASQSHQCSYFAPSAPLFPDSDCNGSSGSKLLWNSQTQGREWRMRKLGAARGNQVPAQGIFGRREDRAISTENQAQLREGLWAMSAIWNPNAISQILRAQSSPIAIRFLHAFG